MKCIKCKIDKPLVKENWEWRSDQQKYRATCKVCLNDRAMERKYKRDCERMGIVCELGDHRIFKICSVCQCKARMEEFTSKCGGMCAKCRIDARKESQRLFHKNHPERRKEIQRKYYRKHRELILRKGRIYRSSDSGRAKEKERQRLYRKRVGDPRKTSISLKLHHNISCSIRGALAKQGIVKEGSILMHLPFSIKDLKVHLETKFEPWMNWNNWGVYSPAVWKDDDPSTWTWNIDTSQFFEMLGFAKSQTIIVQKECYGWC